MNPTSSQIEREVEATRANVEDTVEALKDKMSIGQMVDEASRYFGDKGGSQLVSNLGTQIRDNPLPLLLIGAGVAWLMTGRGTQVGSRRGYRGYGDDSDYESLGEDEYRRTFGESAVYTGSGHPRYSGRSTGIYETWTEGDERSEGGMLEGAGDAARRVRSAASGAASGIGSAASGLASGVASAASGVASGLGAVASGIGSAASGLGSAASQLGRSAYSAAGTVAGGARSGADYARRGGSGAYRSASYLGYGASRFGRGARRQFSDVLESEPLILGAIGLAVGAAIGALLPRTHTEDRYLGETRDRLREEAEAYAREQFERGKAVAEEAYRTAKAEAEAHGLTSFGEDSVAGRIGEVARAAYERAKEKAAEEGLTSGESGQDTGEMQRSSGSSAI